MPRDTTTTWNRVSEADVRRQVGVLANLPWPISFADVCSVVTTQLGWTEWIEGIFLAHLGVDPGAGRIFKLEDGEVSTIQLSLTDSSNDESDERDTFQHEAFSFYAQILKDMYGPGTHAPFPRKHDEMFWDLPSGARVVLAVGIATASTSILSPRLAQARRINARGEH
ncbi:MAG: DUF6301 family protein [Dermatophilaceae bacterium]